MRFLFGLIIGVLALAAFLYFGGPEYLKAFGSKTEQAGTKLEKYEKEIKSTAKEAKEVFGDTAETVKEKAGDAKESIGAAINKAKKAVAGANENTDEKQREAEKD